MNNDTRNDADQRVSVEAWAARIAIREARNELAQHKLLNDYLTASWDVACARNRLGTHSDAARRAKNYQDVITATHALGKALSALTMANNARREA